MSIRLMTLVWDKALPVARKMLLLSLADQANDAGECWPELDDLAARCSISRRTLFECLKELEEGGFIDRRHVGPPGRQRVVFRVNEDMLRQCELLVEPAQQAAHQRGADAARGTGAKSAPVQNPHQREICTGAKNRLDPVRNLHPKKQPKESNPKGEEQRAPAGTHLPPDWEPSAEEREFAATERPDLNVDTEAAKFRDYWRAIPGAKGRRSDWPATWRNWIRRADAPKGAASPPPPAPAPSPAVAKRDIFAVPESPLESAEAFIRRNFDLGLYGEGVAAVAERDRRLAEARQLHGTPSAPVPAEAAPA